MATKLSDMIRSETIGASSPPQNGRDSSGSTTPPGAPATVCPVCNGTGWLRVERELSDPRFGKLEACACQGERTLGRLRALSGLHGAELRVRLGDINPETGPGSAAMVEACRRFIERPAGFLTLWGTVGAGKTTCLYAITNALARSGAVYVSLHDLLDFVRAGFEAAPGDEAAARLKRFATLPVLCLDEIDKVKASDWAAEQLTALVDARFRSGLTGETGTVLALNSDPAQQPAWIASRLLDGRSVVVHNADRDARPFIQMQAPDER